MTSITTINTIEDLVRILREEPTWAEALRALLLSDDVLDLPVRFDRFVEEQKQFNEEQRQTIAELKQFNAEQKLFNEEQLQFNDEMRQFRAEQKQFNSRTDRRLNSIEGRLGNLEGGQYERNVRSKAFARSITIFGFSSPYIAHTLDGVNDPKLTSNIQRALGSGRISQENISELFDVDLIISADDNRHAVFEISLTADNDDIRRAKARAEILAEVTGGEVNAIVVTANLRQPQRRQAEAEDVAIFVAT